MNLPEKKYSVLLADSQFLITESLSILIRKSQDFELAGVANTIADLQTILNSFIDLVITDFSLIDYNGFTGLQKIMQDFPKLKILVLTNRVNKNELNELNKIGITTVVYKTIDKEDLFSAMESAVKNKKFYSDEVLDLVMDNNSSRFDNTESATLTPSEIEIVKSIAEGLTTKEIAAQKHISFHTVMTHRKNIFRKLNINNASELLMFAVRNGLIDNIEYYI